MGLVSNIFKRTSGSTNTTNTITVPPPFIITTVLTTLTLWALVTLVVPLVVSIMLMGYYKSAIALSVLVTVINVAYILKTMLVATVLLGPSSAVTRALLRVGLAKPMVSGGKAYSSSVISKTVCTNPSGSVLRHFEGHTDHETDAALRGDDSTDMGYRGAHLVRYHPDYHKVSK